MIGRTRAVRLGLVAGLIWASATGVWETWRAWRTLPPRFERMAGALRWHDREARRLRTFVAAAREVAPPALGAWCWATPGVEGPREAELFRWASFLAPEHDLWARQTASPGACAVEVEYRGLQGPAPPREGDLRTLLDHRLGAVRRAPEGGSP